jgi:hypothetical protein
MLLELRRYSGEYSKAISCECLHSKYIPKKLFINRTIAFKRSWNFLLDNATAHTAQNKVVEKKSRVRVWHGIVQEYTNINLSYPSDRNYGPNWRPAPRRIMERFVP